MIVLILGDGILAKELNKQTGWPMASRKLTGLDISDYTNIKNTIDDYAIIINCIAFTDSYSKDKEEHWKVNYEFVSELTKACNSNGSKLVHISTEFVYANNIKPPTEEDIPLPDNTWYAYSKLLADEFIKQVSNDYLICRELHKPNNFDYLEVWDVKTSGDKVNKIAKLIIELINNDAKGVFNVGTGDKSLSELNPKGKIVKAPPHVPVDTRMNIDKLKKFLDE